MPKIWNFSAGPAILPSKVLETIQQELVDFQSSGSSVLELSHRSKQFDQIINSAREALVKLLEIPANYEVLFMQGGATSQFSAVVYNLLLDKADVVDYIVTGAWSAKAADEAQRLGANVNRVGLTNNKGHTGELGTLNFSPKPRYIHYCDNETVHGVEMAKSFIDKFPPGADVVCDASSNFLSRKLPVAKYGLIYAGAQKNAGAAGVVIVIIRKDLIKPLDKRFLTCPIMFDYKTMADAKSLYNTPPTFSIYVSGLVFQWVLDQGGVAEMEKRSKAKSELVYAMIQKYPLSYKAPVVTAHQSRMNIPFRVLENGNILESKEAEFIKQASVLGLTELKGHRSVGGVRASVYNAMPIEAIHVLAAFMETFANV